MDDLQVQSFEEYDGDRKPGFASAFYHGFADTTSRRIRDLGPRKPGFASAFYHGFADTTSRRIRDLGLSWT